MNCPYGHFPMITLKDNMVKKFGSRNMTVLYPNLCYNKAIDKEACTILNFIYCELNL